MLLAPFAMAEPTRVATRRARRSTREPSSVAVWMVVWALAGALVLVCVPASRAGGMGGATMPFWLVAAPLINLAWLTRTRWLRRLRGVWGGSAQRQRR